MAPLSKFIRNIANEIELKSGANIQFVRVTTRPTEKWITERDMSKMKAMQLRTAEDIKNKSVVELQQFNPSFFLKDPRDIHCRIPGCSATIQRLKPTRSSEKIKQDLFLCCAHRERLISEVTKRCAEENVIINIASFKKEDFNGYTSLIGMLEKAFTHCQKQASVLSATTNSLLAEVFLNTRNFLVITNALLNPDDDNTKTVLAPWLKMFESFLSCAKDPQKLQSLVKALQEIMNMILLFFGVIYSWVFLGNPGSRVGGGVGLVLGLVGGAAFAASAPFILAASVVGLVAGNLIGSGSYDWYKERHYMTLQLEMTQQYQEFMVRMFGQPGAVTQQPELIALPANADGDLLINMEQN